MRPKFLLDLDVLNLVVDSTQRGLKKVIKAGYFRTIRCKGLGARQQSFIKGGNGLKG